MEFTIEKFPLVWTCIECDNPFEEGDEIFEQSSDYVCEDCCGKPPSHNEGWSADWMIDETEEEFFNHEN
jgi:hypothetical protein